MSALDPAQRLCCTSLGAPLSDDDADGLAAVFKALGDPTRLRLVNLIAAAGEACACDFPAALGKSQPTVSHHLGQLVDAGVLSREQRGKWAWYRVRPERLDGLARALQVD